MSGPGGDHVGEGDGGGGMAGGPRINADEAVSVSGGGDVDPGVHIGAGMSVVGGGEDRGRGRVRYRPQNIRMSRRPARYIGDHPPLRGGQSRGTNSSSSGGRPTWFQDEEGVRARAPSETTSSDGVSGRGDGRGLVSRQRAAAVGRMLRQHGVNIRHQSPPGGGGFSSDRVVRLVSPEPTGAVVDDVLPGVAADNDLAEPSQAEDDASDAVARDAYIRFLQHSGPLRGHGAASRSLRRPFSRSPLGRGSPGSPRGRGGPSSSALMSPGSPRQVSHGRGRTRPPRSALASPELRVRSSTVGDSGRLPPLERTTSTEMLREMKTRPFSIQSLSEGREFNHTRGLSLWLRSSGADTGAMLLRVWRQLRMTWPVFCRFAFCRLKRPGGLEELWSNNWLLVGRILRRMECSHCGKQYLLFAYSEDTTSGPDDRFVIQIEVQEHPGSRNEDPFRLGFPMGFHR